MSGTVYRAVNVVGDVFLQSIDSPVERSTWVPRVLVPTPDHDEACAANYARQID